MLIYLFKNEKKCQNLVKFWQFNISEFLSKTWTILGFWEILEIVFERIHSHKNENFDQKLHILSAIS